MPDFHHPHYDEPGVVFDGGFFYADAAPVTPIPTPKKKRMASLSPNLSRLNPDQLITLGTIVTGKMAPVLPATPPIPGVSAEVALLATDLADADTANMAYEAGKVTLAVLKSSRDAKADQLRARLKSVAALSEGKAMGSAEMLSGTGFPLAGAPQPTVAPGQIMNLAVTASEMDGSLDFTHDPESNSTNYEAQVTTVDPVAGPWVTKTHETVSGGTIPGLTSGQRAWVRVRGHGPKGEGPWSDPATKIVP